ncbi:MAG: sulfatase-like hydrolase/transferase, partial [Verrucomicrobiales bacterium]|nr:sulfatase-like hydrolase/transferase [Verrucomicrobiales bacterium]
MRHHITILITALLPLFVSARPNVIVLTVDDLNFDSLGCFGCPLEGTSPNIDKLAAQSLKFTHAHVNIAVCQPCRGVVMTGRYSHLSGIEGFQHLPPGSETPTLMESMRDAGYRTAILGKVGHFTPKPDFPWDLAKDQPDLGHGRDPKLYAKYTAAHIAASKAADRPFFLVANAHDPHRPFHGNDPEKYRTSDLPAPPPSHTYQPSEVPVPEFLPDIPLVRQEVAEYFSSVRRADDVVGAVLAELEKSGQAENTLVVFFSDHGMALPFSKTNCYYHSTHTPLIVRYPGKTTPGTTDGTHVLST